MSKILGTVVDIAIVGAVAFVGYEVIKCKTQHPNQSLAVCLGLEVVGDVVNTVESGVEGVFNTTINTGIDVAGVDTKKVCTGGYAYNSDSANAYKYSLCEAYTMNDKQYCLKKGYLPLCYSQQDAKTAGKPWKGPS